MRKFTYFDGQNRNGWPEPRELKPYFVAPPGQEWFHTGGNDTAGLWVEGLYGTEAGVPGKTRTDLTLDMYGIPGLGVLLFYDKHGGGYREAFTSKGDMRRLREWVRNRHDDPLPVGLFIPFSNAYAAVKEFIETTVSFRRASSGSPTKTFRRALSPIPDPNSQSGSGGRRRP